MPALPPNSLIVVTGITGYIASHVGVAALQAGHRVRGTVRSLGRGEEVKAVFAKLGMDIRRVEFVVVDDVAIPGSVPGDSDERPQEAIDSNLAVLRAAAKEQSIKRVSLTSSCVAAIVPPDFKDRPLTDQDWNDEAVKRYETSTEEDKGSTDWPAFDVVTLLPPANFGPVLFGAPRSTAGWIYSLLQNDGTCASTVPPQWFIDVRDDARLHILALTTPPLGGKRIWAAAQPVGWNEILAILRRELPHMPLPPDVSGVQGEPDPQKIDNSVAGEVLGIGDQCIFFYECCN